MSAKATNKLDELNGFWAEVGEQNVERLTTVYQEWAKLEKKTIVQASNAVDEMAKLTKASIDFMTEMNDQWRDLAVDTMRKVKH